MSCEAVSLRPRSGAPAAPPAPARGCAWHVSALMSNPSSSKLKYGCASATCRLRGRCGVCCPGGFPCMGFKWPQAVRIIIFFLLPRASHEALGRQNTHILVCVLHRQVNYSCYSLPHGGFFPQVLPGGFLPIMINTAFIRGGWLGRICAVLPRNMFLCPITICDPCSTWGCVCA